MGELIEICVYDFFGYYYFLEGSLFVYVGGIFYLEVVVKFII